VFVWERREWKRKLVVPPAFPLGVGNVKNIYLFAILLEKLSIGGFEKKFKLY